MLRNPLKSKQFLKQLPTLTQQHCFVHSSIIHCHKVPNINRQGKIMSKLFGQRVVGSKKRWLPSSIRSTRSTDANLIFKETNFCKVPRGGGNNVMRRMIVLNKLFMRYITDLMATGEISANLVGKGLQILQVKISKDFANINVYWLSSGEVDEALIEAELQRCSGLLRHELSKLELMSSVPHIRFIKDKYSANLNKVDYLLKNMDFESDAEEDQKSESDYKLEKLKKDLYDNKRIDMGEDVNEYNESLKTLNGSIHAMRHDVLGLDRKGIVLKILTKMRKSSQAWDQYLQNSSSVLDTPNSVNNSSTIPSMSYAQLCRANERITEAAANSEKFDVFLAKRKEKRNSWERNNFVPSDHNIDMGDDTDYYTELVMSKSRRELYEAEDYLLDDMENKDQK